MTPEVVGYVPDPTTIQQALVAEYGASPGAVIAYIKARMYVYPHGECVWVGPRSPDHEPQSWHLVAVDWFEAWNEASRPVDVYKTAMAVYDGDPYSLYRYIEYLCEPGQPVDVYTWGLIAPVRTIHVSSSWDEAWESTRRIQDGL